MESRTYPWLTTFLSYFKTIKEYDIKIESFRSSLSSIPDFTPIALFSYLDINLKSFLTLNDFKSFLTSENLAFEEIRLRKLIHNFDKDGDFSLNLHEFSDLIQSKRKKIKNEYFPNYQNYRLELNKEIKNDFKNILENEMELIKELNNIAKEIINSEIFSTYEAFTLIVGKDKYITKTNFGKFLNDNYMEISEEDVEKIMFRIDADNDDKISYEEFKEIFFPLKDDVVYNNNKNEITNKYMIKEDEKENNNYENNEEQNENNVNDYNKDKYDNYDDINKEDKEEKNIDEENNIDTNNKKKKTTKKVILKPKLQSNLNPDSESNKLYSQNQINKIEESNENNYNKTGKCKNCGVPKKDIINTNKYDIELEIDNFINNYKEDKKNNNDILRENINNKIQLSNNENNSDHKRGNCKACLYTAKNIFSDFRTKNNMSNPFIPKDNFNFNKNEDNKEERGDENLIIENDKNKLEEKNKDDNEENMYDIYKNKDELLKKYGILNDNENNNKIQENNIDISNFNFSTQKKYTYIRENNEDKDENINKINNSPRGNEKTNAVLKSKNNFSTNTNNNNLIETNYSSNILSKPPRINLMPKKDINEKKKLIFKLFLNFIEKETEVRKIKESLISCPDANPQNIFDLFNINKTNKITSSDILETLNSLSSNEEINQDDIKYIFKKYNKTSSNGFTYEDIKNILFSKQISLLNNDNINLEEKTKNIIFELFKEIIEGEKEIENSRILLNEATNNIYYDLFEAIKKEKKLGIEKDDIDKFMKENGYDIKEDEIEIIFEKMDKNKDSQIDYSEFIDEIKPMNFC